MVRTPCCEKMGLKKGPWTPEEDQILVTYIQHYGHENWRALPKQAGLLRCGKSCRLRWINYLRPDIKRGNFTKEEEDTIIKLHQLLGNRWAAIAAKLPGRTDNEIKNFWHTHLKKKLLRSSTTTTTTSTATSIIMNSTPNNYHKHYSNNIGLLYSKCPINPMNMSTNTTVPAQSLAISSHAEDHEETCTISTAKKDATCNGKVIAKYPMSLSSGSATLSDIHYNSMNRNENYENNCSKKLDEEMEFWYNLFVRSSGEPSRVLVNGDHSGWASLRLDQ